MSTLSNVSLRLPNEIIQRLNHLAEATGRSRTFYMTQAIVNQLDDLEDLYIAEQRIIDLRAGKTKSIPLADVMKQYGLEN